jgi:alkylhydroperoxidase/carboxymuconolactone decarboxylase family protein YurZ
VPASQDKREDDMSPEAILARATKARGDVFPEWTLVAHTIPQTYNLINNTGSYLHQYHGQSPEEQQLSGPMRELIATPALCAKMDMRHAPNHIRRMYRMGMTNKVIFEGATAFATVVGWSSLTYVSIAIEVANNTDYPYGKLPEGGQPKTLTPFPELKLGRKRVRPGKDGLLDTPEWKHAAAIDAEMAKRCAAFTDHCLLADGAKDALLGPGPRALIVIAALCMRGDTELAAQQIRRAYDYGMTRRQVLEAISCVFPMSGMVTGTIGLRAMRLADGPATRRKAAVRKSGGRRKG